MHRDKVGKNPSSMQSQERVPTDHTDGNVASASPPGGAAIFDYESENRSQHLACEKQLAQIKKKYNHLTELVKSQI